MATQLAEAPGGDAGGAENENTAINYEAEASKMGWKPLEEFKGDPQQHVDAKTFYERGQEIMPILKAQNKAMSQKIAAMERDMKRSAEFFSKAEERAYERALADIQAKMDEAVESGDTKAARAAMDELKNLEKPGAATKGEEPSNEDRAEVFADWVKANQWYVANDALRAYAEAQADKIGKAKGGMLDGDDLNEISSRVKAKFEDVFPDAFGGKKPETQQRRSPVDGGGTVLRSPRGGRTFGDLPVEAQRLCDKWVERGVIKSRDDYVKNYQW